MEDLWIYVNLETGKINDLRKTSVDEFLNERDQPNMPWVSIRMVGLDFQPGEDWVDKKFNRQLDVTKPHPYKNYEIGRASCRERV